MQTITFLEVADAIDCVTGGLPGMKKAGFKADFFGLDPYSTYAYEPNLYSTEKRCRLWDEYLSEGVKA